MGDMLKLIGWASISARYKRITRQLNTDFWSTDSETAHSLYVGSYGRDTSASGVSDLDIAFVLPVAHYTNYKAYRSLTQNDPTDFKALRVCA
jgi:tRNA nucleotidyltransferase (CCA-adding enzyme)